MTLHFKRNANWLVAYAIIGILAAVITIFLSSLTLPFKYYRLFCTELESKKNLSYRVYKELNADGKAEEIILNRTMNGVPDPYITILDSKKGIITKKVLKEQWEYNSWWVGDFNGDSLNEFYVFTRKRKTYLQDSLFIYGIDISKSKPDFLNRVYVASLDQFYQKTINNKPWLINVYILGMWDADGDGYKDLVFHLGSRGYDFNRVYDKTYRIFAFSIKKRRIVKVSPKFKNKYLFDFFKSDSGKIGIYPLYEHVPKKKGSYYFFILNKQLTYDLKPIEIKNHYISSLYFVPFNRKQNEFLALQPHSRVQNKKITYIKLLNTRGTILKEFKLKKFLIPVTNINSDKKGRYYEPLFWSNGQIYKFNFSGKLTLVYSPDYRTTYIRMNVDSDPELELVNIHMEKSHDILTIIQNNFKDISKVEIPGVRAQKNKIFSIKSRREGNTVLSLSTQEFDGLYLYGPNPYYHLNFFFIFIGFLIIAFVLYGMFKLFNTLAFYYHFLTRHLNTVNKGVLLVTFKGDVQHYNRNFMKMLRLPAIKQGMNVRKLFQAYPQISEQMEKLLSGQKSDINTEITLQHPDKIFKGRLIGYFLSGMAGIPSGYCLELYDLSETILSEREEIIARLIRKMAHDIKTPLSTIKFAIEAMHYILPDPEYKKVEEDVTTVVQEVNHIHAITDNYSKFARLSRLNLEVISLKEVINKVINSYGYLETVKVSVNVAPDAEMLTADGTQIELLIKEIFENALDAVGSSGDINFETYPVRFGEKQETEAVTLRISDNGVGIAKEIRDRIFEPSFSTKNQGTGFGLVLAQRIVQNHGGQITIDSEEGKGTHVLIILPKDAI